jgi:predicted amidohydrolase
MSISCAQPTNDDTPLSVSEPEVQPTIVNAIVTKITEISEKSNYILSGSGTEIRIKTDTTNTEYVILNTSTPIGTYTNVFFPDEIELEYSNGEKRVVIINQFNGVNINTFFSGTIKFNGLLDIFLNGLDVGKTVLKWNTFYKYK